MADLTPIPMGIPWDPWDPSLPHSHAHLYMRAGYIDGQRRAPALSRKYGQCRVDRRVDDADHRLVSSVPSQ